MPPSTAQAFTKVARSRLSSPNASLPHPQILFYLDSVEPTPNAGLYESTTSSRTRGRSAKAAKPGLHACYFFLHIHRTSTPSSWLFPPSRRGCANIGTARMRRWRPRAALYTIFFGRRFTRLRQSRQKVGMRIAGMKYRENKLSLSCS